MNTRNIVIIIVTVFAAMLVCFLVATELFLYETGKAIKAVTQSISQDFKNAFNTTPIITVNNRVVISESRPIAELATASKAVSVDTTYSSTWLHSTKVISVRGDFVAKAGFDLNSTFKINIDTHPKLVTVTLPYPRILSVEMKSNEITDEKGGIVNWLTPQDHEAALKQLTDAARLQISDSTIRNAAKEEMEKRIRAIGALKDMPVKIQYGSDQQILERPKG